MSAKEFYQKPYIQLPELPPELWGVVIRHATLIPEGIELDFSVQQVGFRGPTIAREQFKSLQTSLVTKRSVVRVNKAWQKLATPFLYEYVALVRGKSLPSLIEGLGRYEGEAGFMGLGWWTHRLDIVLRDYLSSIEDAEADVARVLAHMPNLRILTSSNIDLQLRFRRGITPYAVLEALNCCRASLESIHLYMPPIPSCHDWTLFLENHPDIQSINGTFSLLRDSRITLDKLTTMHVASGLLRTNSFYPWHLGLPSLRAMTYGLNVSVSNPFPTRHLFERVGPQLTLLQVSFIEAGWFQPAVLASAFRLVFSTVLETCQNLEQMNLAFYSWVPLSLCAPILPPKVHKLGIRIVTTQISKSMTLAVFTSSLRVIARLNPSLKTVQFLSKRNVQALQHCHCQFYEGLRVFKETGVDVLDDEGTAI